MSLPKQKEREVDIHHQGSVLNAESGRLNEDVYLLPRGQQETKRLNEQHRYILDLCDGNIMSPQIPTDSLEMVADVCTGSGAWLLDLDQRLRANGGSYSTAFHGFDISSVQFPNLDKDQESRFKFSVHDVRKPFPREHLGQYDLVHLRLLMWALPTDEIETVIANLSSLLKPGGYLAWDEAAYVDWVDTSGTPECVRIHDIIVDYMKKRNFCVESVIIGSVYGYGIDANIESLPSVLRKSFDNVGLEMRHSINYSSRQHPEIQAVTNKIIGDGAMSVLRNLSQEPQSASVASITPEQRELREEMRSLMVSWPVTQATMKWQYSLQSIIGRRPVELPLHSSPEIVA
ncbi:hypothetical protein ACHAPA_009769 [Fusarium lateritium]